MRRLCFLVASFALPLLAVAACSSSTDDAPGTSTSSSSSSSSSGGSTSSSGEPGPSSGSSGTTSSGGSTSSGSSGSGDGGSDGPTGDAPTGRDYGTNRAAFFGASRCAAAKLAFCDDFEGQTIDATKWSTVGTKPTIDSAQHARGAKSLHVAITGNGASYVKTTKPFPALKDRYWGRAFVSFGKLPGAPMTYSHWTFAAATGSGVAGEIRLSGQLQNGKNLFGVGTDNRSAQGTGDWTNSDKDPTNAPRAVPSNEWMCIEWLHAGDTDETQFYWDATLHPSLSTTAAKHGGNTNPYVLPTFEAVWVGWQEYQPTTLPFEMWVDEVAFDHDRIGCVL